MIPARTPFIITQRIDEILRAVRYYRYMTALDVTYLLFSPKSITHVREILKNLCGGSDAVDNQYLFRFPLPQTLGGKTEKVFTLGSRGRDYLTREGLRVDWYFRPHHIRHLSQGILIHNLTLTRFLICAHVFAKNRKNITLSDMRISYEIEKNPGQINGVKVIPDGWLLFDDTQSNTRLPVLLEIDRGTEYKNRFKDHIRSRLEFIRSGAYEKMFSSKGCTIAYATTGELPIYRESRCKSMQAWTIEVLTEKNMKNWSVIFRFAGIERERLYDAQLFDGQLWFEPGEKRPKPLLSL